MVAPVTMGEQYRATWHHSGGDTWPTNHCMQACQVRMYCTTTITRVRDGPNQSGDTLSNSAVSVRGRRVSGTRSECMDLCQSLAIMRRLVNGKKTKIPLDLAI
ncbi:hypothetical protein Tco_1546727 [Tanacetum coccineum]